MRSTAPGPEDATWKAVLNNPARVDFTTRAKNGCCSRSTRRTTNTGTDTDNNRPDRAEQTMLGTRGEILPKRKSRNRLFAGSFGACIMGVW